MAAPTARLCIAVGDRVVPVQSLVLGDAQGVLRSHKMINITERKCGWLWESLGCKPNMHLPLLQEIWGGVKCKRGKRKANVYLDDQGEIMASLVSVHVRGKDLQVANNLKHLCLNLGDDMELLNWFLQELFKDLQSTPPEKPKLLRTCKSKDSLCATALAEVRAHAQVKYAHFSEGKFRVVLHNDALKHKSVPKYIKLANMGDAGLQLLVEQTARSLIDDLEDDAPAEAPVQHMDVHALVLGDAPAEAPGVGQQMDEVAIAPVDEDAGPAPVQHMEVHALVLVDAPDQVAPGQVQEESQ